jgi:hypothetical protein
MLSLWHLLLLLFATETAPDPADEQEEEEEEEGTEETETEEEEEEIRDPEKMALSREAGKWRKKFRAAEARIAELEEADVSEPFREARMENAFLRAVMERGDVADLDTAWDLLHVRGFIDVVTLDGDGQVDGMSDTLEKLLDRYPWLSDEPPESDEENDDPDRPRRTAPPPKMRKGKPAEPSKDQLQDRFPTLMRRR